MGNKLSEGGTAYINVRSRNDVNSTTVIKKRFGPTRNAELITGRGTYQKGFQKQELVNFIKEVLGPDYSVAPAKFGSIAVTVTKKSESKAAKPSATDQIGEGVDILARLTGLTKGIAPVEGDSYAKAIKLIGDGLIAAGKATLENVAQKVREYVKTLGYKITDEQINAVYPPAQKAPAAPKKRVTPPRS